MSILVIGALLVVGYILYRFLSWKRSVEKDVERRGGIKSVYEGFVDTLKERGLEVKELTPNSIYLHYGNQNGKIGAQLIVTGREKAEVTMEEETPTGEKHEVGKVITSGSASAQSKVAEEMLSQMPSREVILPSGGTDARERQDSGSPNGSGSESSSSRRLNQKVQKMGRPRRIRVLHEAAEDGETEVMQAVLDTGIEPDADVGSPIPGSKDEESDNPLHVASEFGEMGAVRVLLDAGADVNALGRSEETPLHRAAAEGHVNIVEALIESGADVNYVSDGFVAEGEAPLHPAAKNGEPEVVKMLLDAGAEPNITTNGRHARTPLHFAVKKDNHEVVRMLINAGADTDTQGFQNNTPLHWASGKRMAKLLISAGADVNATAYGKTPLHTAKNGEVAKTLIDAGADVRSTTSSGQQPLHRVSMHGDPEAVRALLSSGADPNATDDSGDTPLHYTVKRGKVRNAKVLLQLGSDPNVTNEDGETPRDTAVDQGEEEIARLLAQQ